MIRAVILALSCIAAAGCQRQAVRAPEPAVAAQCDARCNTPCDTRNPRWEADPNDPAAWDALPTQVIAPLVEQRDTCELHRLACAQCLCRLQEAGEILFGECP